MTNQQPLHLRQLVESELLGQPGARLLDSARGLRTLFRAGEPAQYVYYVRSGMVKVERSVADCRQPILGIRRAGELAGEECLFGSGQFETTAVQIAEGEVYQIQRDLFIQHANQVPGIWRSVAEVMACYNECQQDRYQMLQEKGVEERLLWVLEQLSRTQVPGLAATGGGGEIPLTQAELAALIGATRETTSTTLNSLERRGVLELKRRKIVLGPQTRAAAAAVASPAAG
jgi:CRP/FNR family transcriptional regulator